MFEICLNSMSFIQEKRKKLWPLLGLGSALHRIPLLWCAAWQNWLLCFSFWKYYQISTYPKMSTTDFCFYKYTSYQTHKYYQPRLTIVDDNNGEWRRNKVDTGIDVLKKCSHCCWSSVWCMFWPCLSNQSILNTSAGCEGISKSNNETVI